MQRSTAALCIAGACISLGVMVIGVRIPFVPTWQPAKTVIIGVGASVALAFIVAATVCEWRKSSSPMRRRLVAFASIAAGLCLLGTTWFIILDTFGVTYLGGEGLAETIVIPERDSVIFVYHLGEFPDGIVASRVAVREGWLPFERTVLTVAAPLQKVQHQEDALLFSFGRGRMARYDYASGRMVLIEP